MKKWLALFAVIIFVLIVCALLFYRPINAAHIDTRVLERISILEDADYVEIAVGKQQNFKESGDVGGFATQPHLVDIPGCVGIQTELLLGKYSSDVELAFYIQFTPFNAGGYEDAIVIAIYRMSGPAIPSELESAVFSFGGEQYIAAISDIIRIPDANAVQELLGKLAELPYFDSTVHYDSFFH